MPRRRYNAEEIIRKLREVDVELTQSKTFAETCMQLGAPVKTSTACSRNTAV